jgi:hypothetical protein
MILDDAKFCDEIIRAAARLELRSKPGYLQPPRTGSRPPGAQHRGARTRAVVDVVILAIVHAPPAG